jgi:glutathione peroxidase
MNFHSLEAKTPAGETINMSQYKGKVILIVNTATKCGLTYQFKGLENLHQQYKKQGLLVLGFPCNQFLGQEPLSNENMEESCLINHGVTFQLFNKIDVNGKHTHPIYKYLKKKLRGGIFSSRIRWNFEKFLINADGNPVKRFSPKTKPEELENDIRKLLNLEK